MTPLKAAILRTLKAHGPLSDLGLWGKVGDQETGGMACIVIIACLELEKEGCIQTPPNEPQLWQLTDKGENYVANAGAAHA